MDIPLWADEAISKLIPELRKYGEGQNVEFIAGFSEQVRQIAKEVAAFASCGGGKILLGVCDDGLIGQLNANDHDDISHRVQGIVRNVQPTVTYKLHLCFDRGFVLLIDIAEKQDEPVFYCEQRPYVRDFRTSRPATPGEVKELVWKHASSEGQRRHEDLLLKIAEDHHAAMARSRDSFQRTSESTRRAFIPKR